MSNDAIASGVSALLQRRWRERGERNGKMRIGMSVVSLISHMSVIIPEHIPALYFTTVEIVIAFTKIIKYTLNCILKYHKSVD